MGRGLKPPQYEVKLLDARDAKICLYLNNNNKDQQYYCYKKKDPYYVTIGVAYDGDDYNEEKITSTPP